ncbi:riboflavin synthase [bacterium]|nr:riboflavin synthase [bacterium]
MFTGIIEELGKIQGVNVGVNSGKLTVECETVLVGTKFGDSIALNGVCLTVVDISKNYFIADVSPETIKVTSLSELKIGDVVNLERAMPADGRFGGHIVSGHVDGLARFIEAKKNGDFYDLKIELNSNQSKYVVKKGSISINGISLTVASIVENTITIAVIPHTYENTNLKFLKRNDFVNIEVDMMARYIEKFLSSSDNKSRISLEFLQEHGF